MKKRITAFLLALVMLLSLMPLTALAAESGKCGDDLTWELDASGELYIEGSGAMYDYTEDEEAPWQGSASSITSVLLPEGLTHLGDRSLIALTKLEELELPTTLTSIGAYALNSCTALTELVLPEKLATIGEYGMASMAGLLKISLPEGCVPGTGAFSGDIKLASAVLPSDLTEIPENLFMGCVKLTDVEIPAGVTSIGAGAFSGDIVLAEIEIPDQVESVGEGAFSGCIALTDVNLPESVKTLETSVFSGCTGLVSAHLPSGLTEIPESTFAGCTALTTVNIPDNVTSIGAYAFSMCGDLAAVTLPEGLETIGDYAFFNCTSLSTLTIPKSVTSIGENAFAYLALIVIRPLDITLYVYTDYTEQYCIDNDLRYVRLTATIIRLAGSNRTKTAVEISKASFEKADTVVLASGNDFPDALAGGPLAYALNAPILLVRGKLDDATRGEISRLGAKKVIILGGEVAVGKAVEEELEKTYTVERIAGGNRFETAVKIAERLAELKNGKNTEIFFASAENYPDALAISPVAAIKKAPILYIAPTGSLKTVTKNYVKSAGCESAVILGGEMAVGKAAETALEELGCRVERYQGDDRYATNLTINEAYASVLDGNGLSVATGKDYPDALTGGVYAALRHEPLLLVGSKLRAAQPSYIKARSPKVVTIFGGTTAVSEAVENEIIAALA